MLKILSSYYLFIVLLLILAIGAAIATFIENDFGAKIARKYVYNALWYETLLLLASLNLLLIIFETKMYKQKIKFLFHSAFIVILLGGGLTRYFGLEGTVHIREGNSSNTFKSLENNDIHTLPFIIELTDFQMIRYPGSKSPSEYSSYVRVVDNLDDKKFDFHIYMNHTLAYKGYKFFQTSFDPDEKGTILTVNKDPGKELTYIGYVLLFLGLILNLFSKNSRVYKLYKRSFFMLLTLFIAFGLSQDLRANSYIMDFKDSSKELAEAFGRLTVQSKNRMKPLDTLSREIMRKVSGSEELYQLNSNQMILGMFLRSNVFKKIPMIKVNHPKILKLISLAPQKKLASFDNFFKKRKYILSQEIERVHNTKESLRNSYDKELIKVDERLNIVFMVYQGSLLKIFPLPRSKDKIWLEFKNMFVNVEGEIGENIRQSIRNFIDSGFNRNFPKALTAVKQFRIYQQTYGTGVVVSDSLVEKEILLNKANIFENLTFIYFLMGIALLFMAFYSIFKESLYGNFFLCIIIIISALIFLAHTLGLFMRWHVSGHAPFSNAYESIIYLAYSCMIAGLVFFRRSLFALSAAFIMAGIFMFTAHLGNIDPEITSLVPVLKSYWLSIHVSIITASYGFFGVSSLLGLFTLILFIFKNKSEIISIHIGRLTDINEISLIIGLTLLVIGNFLGAVWANESWGRYWGWDPKETWSYISIIIYTLVTHLRLFKKLYSMYLFAVLSLVSFASILMTYFGVNFYLAGKHSYASGDPVPIPLWVYLAISLIVTLIAISRPKPRVCHETSQ